jgi:hypothetical protein
MSGQPGAEGFWTRLRALYEEAGSPDLATLNRQGKSQQPQVSLSDATLSDWFTGKSIPSKTKESEFRFLVEFLEGRTGTRGDALRHRVDEWLRLCTAARRARRPASPGGGSPPARLGRPAGKCDPLVLEVHPAIHVPGERDERLDRLPTYVPRAHDTRLREAVDEALADGSSRLLTVVGGSSTGKTRACWELVQYLEQHQPGRWWLWHPYDPTRPDAALADLDRVGPNTIVWLNEAQFYLAPPDAGLGERIAAGLRTLLDDPPRGPVLVLATLWPQHWDDLTFRPSAG